MEAAGVQVKLFLESTLEGLYSQLASPTGCQHHIRDGKFVDTTDFVRGQIKVINDILSMPALLQDKELLELERTMRNLPQNNNNVAVMES